MCPRADELPSPEGSFERVEQFHVVGLFGHAVGLHNHGVAGRSVVAAVATFVARRGRHGEHETQQEREKGGAGYFHKQSVRRVPPLFQGERSDIGCKDRKNLSFLSSFGL